MLRGTHPSGMQCVRRAPTLADISESTRRWRMLEAAGLLVVSLSLFAITALAMEVIPPVITFGTIYLLLAVAVWRFAANRWVAGVAAGLALLGLLANLPFLMEDLAHPASFGGFVPSAVSVVAAVVVVIAAIASYRGMDVALAQPLARGALATGGALALLSVVLLVMGANDEAQTGDAVVVAEKHHYPSTISAPAGRSAIVVENKDLFRHTFVLTGRDVKLEVPAMKTRRLEVDLPVGLYPYICDGPGHEAMAGVLTVQ